MKRNPLISVIVPVYNVEPYIRKCVESILAQTHANLELILVDDGSPDNSGAICEEYAQKDPRVIVIHQENTGQAGARNRGIALAKGEYIGFVDSDDWIAPDMYQTMLESAERNNCDLVICGRYVVRGEKNWLASDFNMAQELVMDTQDAMKRFLTYRAIDSSSVDKLYKRELLQDVRFPLGYICEDVPFVYDALKKSRKVVHCAKPLYYNLLREGSTSRSGFNQKGMGLYYHFKDVCERCKIDFPQLAAEADYLYYKNLLVLACRIARAKGGVPQRKMINVEVCKGLNKILRDSRHKKTYKVLACTIALGLERPAIRLAEAFGLRLA